VRGTKDLGTCSTIKESLGSYFGSEVRVSNGIEQCIVTLPLRTLDERFVSVVIEERLGGYYLVHDAGKTDSALFSQGVKLTDQKVRNQHEIAEHYGVQIVDGLIQQACRLEDINEAVLSVAQSVLLAAHEILHHHPDFSDVPITGQVGKALESWKPPFILRIDKDVRVIHAATVHRLNYVAHARDGRQSCAVKIVPPTHPTWQARIYGFSAHELDEDPILKGWLRLAILTRAET
jgi:hypothetical protein